MKIKKTEYYKSRISVWGRVYGTILLMVACISAKLTYSQTIPANFFGINYWMPNEYLATPGSPNGFVNYTPLQTQIRDMGAGFYRIGGNGYDETGYSIGTNAATNDYIAAIAAVKSINASAKFLIQVPFEAGIADTNLMSAHKARILVNNIKLFYTSDLFYYAIGNEWDMYVDPANPVSPYKYTSAAIASYIKAYAIQMKSADPGIRIVAPAVAFFAATDKNGNSILSRLIGGTDDITMKITGSGNVSLDNIKYYIDVVDYHTYAGGSSGNMSGINSGNYATYRAASIAYPNGGFATELSTSTGKLQYLLTQANTVIHTRSGTDALTYGITEMNIDWKNPPLTGSGSPELENTPEGLGPRSFFAGQYWLDMFSSILKNGTNTSNNKVEFVTPWSPHEHGGDGLSTSTGSDLGMTKGTASSTQAPTPLPTYWSYQMIATNFEGTYLPNLYASGTNYKAFAYKNTSAAVPEIGVIIMNQDEQSPRGSDNTLSTLEINFNNSAPGSGDLRFQFNGSVPSVGQYSCNITKETTMFLAFRISDGALLRKEVYTLQDALRTNDTGPEVWVSPTPVPITLQTEFDFHTNQIYQDLVITPASGITEGSTDTKVFKFINTATVNGIFDVPLGATFSIIPTISSCP
ncbi:MAG: hypothetical protein JWO44_754 [Bacteroidetes bacterium]|nr:hypothetical protein [Bacteroidota bacterium]